MLRKAEKPASPEGTLLLGAQALLLAFAPPKLLEPEGGPNTHKTGYDPRMWGLLIQCCTVLSTVLCGIAYFRCLGWICC